MKTVEIKDRGRGVELLHVEADGCIVNIRVGLTDNEGRRVTSVEILPDTYVNEEWDLDGYSNNRVIERAKADVPG